MAARAARLLMPVNAGTADADKRTYLVNALVNALRDDSWDQKSDLAEMLMRLVSVLTATHIRLLALFTDQLAWQKEYGNIESTLHVGPGGVPGERRRNHAGQGQHCGPDGGVAARSARALG